MVKQKKPSNEIELPPLSFRDSICNQLQDLIQRYQSRQIDEASVLDLLVPLSYKLTSKALGIDISPPKVRLSIFHKIGKDWLRETERK